MAWIYSQVIVFLLFFFFKFVQRPFSSVCFYCNVLLNDIGKTKEEEVLIFGTNPRQRLKYTSTYSRIFEMPIVWQTESMCGCKNKENIFITLTISRAVNCELMSIPVRKKGIGTFKVLFSIFVNRDVECYDFKS